MARVRIDDGELVVEMEGMDKLWALKSRLSVPLANVRGAAVDPGVAKRETGIRAPGASVPGVITAGTFFVEGERVFWDVHDGVKAVVIELVDERYARLVVEVDDPAGTVALIEQAVHPA